MAQSEKHAEVAALGVGNGLWHHWERLQAENPRRVAVVDATTGTRCAVGKLGWMAVRLAQGELAQASGRGVSYCLPNGIEWLSTFLALQRNCSAAVPLDSALSLAGRKGAAEALGAEFLWQDGQLTSLQPKRRIKVGCCCVKSTSGSTGLPKSVDCQPGHLLADGRNIIRTMGIRPADRNLALIPLGHSYGLGNLVMPLILQGTALVCATDYVPAQVLSWIAQYRVTVYPGVPVVFALLANAKGTQRIGPLRLAISAGSVLHADTARAFVRRFGVKIHNFYGSSETGGICYDRDGDASLWSQSVGKPLDGVQVHIRRQRVEVCSDAVVSNHHAVVLPDRGRWNTRGELQLLGRICPVADIGGKKVDPRELEAAIRGIKGVRDAWAEVFNDGKRDHLIAAAETNLSCARVTKELDSLLASWKQPRRILVETSLPRTSRGKLDRVHLRKRILGEI